MSFQTCTTELLKKLSIHFHGKNLFPSLQHKVDFFPSSDPKGEVQIYGISKDHTLASTNLNEAELKS